MNLLRVLGLFLLSLSIFTIDCFGQSTVKTASKTSGVITGRVTAHGKGLPGVTVMLRSSNFGGQTQSQDLPQAKTDTDGNYRLTDIPIGSYFVTPVAPVYTVPGAGRLTSTNEAVVITGGDTVNDIDFSLVPGGVITGRVTDTEGRPVIEQSVILQSVDQQNQQGFQRTVAPGNWRTDDRGVYRIYGVPEGHYIVSVGAQQRMSGYSGLNAYSTIMGQKSYVQTFHPDTTDSTQATIVEVAEGAEVSNVDITVGRTVEEYSVTGHVLDSSSNAPLPNLSFTLNILGGGGNRQRALSMMALPIVSDSAGTFRLDNVPPGRYMISVAPQSGTNMWGQSQPFDVINQDVNGVEVKATIGANVSGVVTLEGNQDPSILAELMQFQVEAFVQSGDGRGGGFGGFAAASAQTVPLNTDGTFQVNGLPSGNVRLALMPQDSSLQGAFKILRIERDGTQQNRGITVNSGDQITGVRIVAAYADGTVEGLVKFQNGTPAPGTRVFARLSSSTPGQGRGGNLGAANVDQRGHFLIQNVPPGSYNLVVTAFAQGGRRRNQQPQPQTPVTAQQQVNVSEGQVTSVTVSLDLGQNNPPNNP
ncbi:MAG TPA: carboxypeptidase-like regulatory domain-containing protein [Pyrinomonadaceae bacterium]|nr:carboxypeptidase-like regulatory domain-containing protein [Pyrinomonadaceae bacterium]